MKKKSALAQKIVQRLVEMGEIDPEVYDIESAQIERFYPGHWQRSEGAWSWQLGLEAFDRNMASGRVYGSQYTAGECAKAKHWDFYVTGPDVGIFPSRGEFNDDTH